MRYSLHALACLAALTAAPCLASTPYSLDVSDLWLDPAESGWGINLAQQSEIVFATMFVYGPDGRPRWYSASSMTGTRTGSGMAFSGKLVESTGPVQPGTFDPTRVTRREVGNISFVTRSDSTADLDYTVDGVAVHKSVQRFTMKAPNASGEYVGYRSARGCGTGNDPLSNNAANIRILQSGSQFTMTSTVLNETCTYTGTPSQRGRIGGASGTFSCSGQTPPGTFEITGMDVGYQGFLAKLTTRTSASCTMEARFVGLATEGSSTARATVDASDLWWTSTESGWGINFQQQDNIAFATIFTYGANGEPKWYSASDLRVRFTLAGGQPSFEGNLYESTGPSFATSFNPALVSRRVVGLFTATPATGSPDELNLLYYIDGVSYSKKVKRFTTRGNDPTGTYQGGFSMRNPCSGGGTGLFYNASTFTLSQSGGIFQMIVTNPRQMCLYTAPMEQRGRTIFSQGTYKCSGDLPEAGTFRVFDLEIGQDGMMGQLLRGDAQPDSLPFAQCTMFGRFGGVRAY